MARRDENGYFYIIDRKKDVVIVGGYNVYPREVEEVLFTHPALSEAAVIGIPDSNYGEAVHAFVVLKEDASVDEAALISYCAERLVKYKVPKHIKFLNELPRNSTGKILKSALKD